MKLPVYNINAESVGEAELNPKIFNVPIKKELIQEALRIQMANSRKVIAHTKGRAEVRGGGKKPWKQKGTGRARHGSIRSPLWIGGGVTFGPTNERNYSLKINKKAKKRALAMCLSDKAAEDGLILIDKFELKDAKTKEIKSILEKFSKIGNREKETRNEKSLIVYTGKSRNLIKAGRNIEKIRIIGSNNLNIKDILSYNRVIMEQSSLEVINQLYS